MLVQAPGVFPERGRRWWTGSGAPRRPEELLRKPGRGAAESLRRGEEVALAFRRIPGCPRLPEVHPPDPGEGDCGDVASFRNGFFGGSWGAPNSPKSTLQTQGKGAAESPTGPPRPGRISLSDGLSCCPPKHVPLWKPTCPDSGTRKMQLSDGSAPVALSRPVRGCCGQGRRPGLPSSAPLPSPQRTPAPDVRAGASGWGDQEGGFRQSCPPGRGAPSLR